MSLFLPTRSIRAVLAFAVLVTAFAVLYFTGLQPSSAAAAKAPSAKPNSRRSFPNYDIRIDKAAQPKLDQIRSRSQVAAARLSDVSDKIQRGVGALRSRVPTLKVEYGSELKVPEVISPDPVRGKAFLSAPVRGGRALGLKGFLKTNRDLIGATSTDVDSLEVAADYTNPDGGMSFVTLRQHLNGIPVFRGEVKAGFSPDGEIVRVVNNFAPGLDTASVSKDFGDPAAAVQAAMSSIGHQTADLHTSLNSDRSTDQQAVFGKGEEATTAEKIYFPTEAGVAVPAWRVLIWEPVDAYYVIVDPSSGTVLWRKNITEDQSQPASYSVYTNPNAFLNLAHSPFPMSPGPTSPNGVQGAAIPRTTIVRVGNESPYTFNQLGWIPDGLTKTDGNAVQAGLDRDGTDGIDPDSEAVSQNRVFDYAYAPLDPNTGLGDPPVTATQTYPGSVYQQGAITQLFYICNLFHDETYRMGFTEAAGNFQNVNFTGVGTGGDRVRAEAQDSSGTNNANFSTAADGVRGRMQMYIFTGPNPDIDGSLDADVVIHEHTHGLSNRLHGNGSGLTNDMSRGMGEGWSDFFGMSMLSQPSDPIDGVYTTAAYVTYRFGGSFVNNSYYGIRRFPTAIMSSVGANGKPHNPLTFADIDATKIDLTDGAFAANGGGNADEVHNAGEIWCAMLWEVRARMITRLGWAEGNRRAMQFVINGMKLAPLSPTFVSERDAIIAAAFASGTSDDLADIWAGFAARGLGANASVQNAGGISIGGTGTARVTESFALPNLSQTPSISVSDASGDNDGYPEPREKITISVPLTNSTGRTATGVTLQAVGGGTADFGDMAGASVATRSVTYDVPANAPCGGTITVNFNVNSSLGPATFSRQVYIGKPDTVTTSENFDGVTAPAIPQGWTAEAVSQGVNFVTSTNSSDTAPNSVFAADPTSIGGGTDLTSPPVSVTSASATVTFRHSFATEAGWDGGVLEISIAGGDFQDIVTSGGAFVQNGYNSALGAGRNNPIASRPAWTGNSNGYMTSVVQLPPAANGKVVRLRWRFGADDNTGVLGWNIDSVSLSGAGFVTSFACALPVPTFAVSGRVVAPNGLGIRNATVTLTGPPGGPLRVLTSSLGFFRFSDVPAGTGYSVKASSKMYRFTAASIDVNGDLAMSDLVGQE